jgi:hypothetical protein
MAAPSTSPGTSSMRARPWASSVMIGICQPIQLRAFRPMLRRVRASRPEVTCSPEATTTSYSSSDSGSPAPAAARPVGPGDQLIGLARHGRDDDGDLFAGLASAATMRAARRIRSRSPMDVPPNFITNRSDVWSGPRHPAQVAPILRERVRRFIACSHGRF